MRSSVDLPQPEGPTSATSSPRATVSEMSRSASTGPDDAAYVMPTRSRMITVTRSIAFRRVDPGQVLARVHLVASDLARHVGHVRVDELDGAAHLPALHPPDPVLGIALGFHQIEAEHHVRLDQRHVDVGHALLEDL